MPVVAALFPIRVYITIAGTFSFPVAAHGDITAAFPVPVAAGPDVARTWARFNFHVLHGWRLRRDDFDIGASFHHDPAFMVWLLVDATGSSCNQCEHSDVT
jgi:hypothetical protein